MVLFMGLGEKLKEAREAKGISLEQLQETTKIQKRYLQAIEQGNFQTLPGTFYARAFIKEYANAVGLDADLLLEEHKGEIPVPEEDTTTPQYRRIQRSRKDASPAKTSPIFSAIPTVIVIVLIIGILFVAWYLVKQTIADEASEPVEQTNDNEIYRSDEDENIAGEDATDEEEADNSHRDDASDEEDEEAETDAEPELILVDDDAETSTFDLVHADDEVKVTLESSGQTWLEVEDDNGESIYYDTLTAEKSPVEFDVTDKERIYFNIGHAPDLTIMINGVEVEYPVDPNENVVQKIWININEDS